MADLEFIIRPEEEYELPSYQTPGRMLVRVGPLVVERPSWQTAHEFEILDYDLDSSVFWIQEGGFMEYWLEGHCEFPADGGTFVIESIVGHYYPGDGWDRDADEEWEYGEIRSATLEEIEMEALVTENSNLV